MRTLLYFIIAAFLLSCSDKPPVNFDASYVLGKSINSAEAQSAINALGSGKEVSRFENVTYYNFKKQGISIVTNRYDSIKGVFFYSEGVDGYDQYKGALPYDLKFTMTRKNVNQKLGKPDSKLGSGVVEFNEVYKKTPPFILGLTYKSKDTSDFNNPIKVISMTVI